MLSSSPDRPSRPNQHILKPDLRISTPRVKPRMPPVAGIHERLERRAKRVRVLRRCDFLPQECFPLRVNRQYRRILVYPAGHISGKVRQLVFSYVQKYRPAQISPYFFNYDFIPIDRENGACAIYTCPVRVGNGGQHTFYRLSAHTQCNIIPFIRPHLGGFLLFFLRNMKPKMNYNFSLSILHS